MTRHVLVTGGAGFIGSHLVDAYLDRGYRVSVVDDFSTGREANLNARAEVHRADIRDASTADLVRRLRPDVISHHAAQMDIRKSVADPAHDASVNVVGSLQLLQAAADAGVQRFIFASSGGAIYGDPESAGPQTEEHTAAPVSPYGCAKLAVEHYLHYFRVVKGLSSVALRYANVYGPRQSAKGEAGVIAIWLDRIKRNESAVINGGGEQSRDFVYVDDVVAANLAVTEGDWDGAFNVGTGVETSIRDLYALIAAAAGIDRPATHADAKAGEQMRSVIDASKLWTRANLKAPVELKEGIRTTVGWFLG